MGFRRSALEDSFSLAVVCLPEVDTPVAALVMVYSRTAVFLAVEFDDCFSLAGVFAEAVAAAESFVVEAFCLNRLELFSAAFGFLLVATAYG